MLSWIREKFGTVVIGGIIAFIAFVFVFYGVFSPKATRGLHEGSVAGTVNGDAISISEFNRALNQRIEFFKNFAGGKITEDQLKQFGVRESVFQELANRKIMLQEAKKIGIIASDEEVKEKIQEIPAFHKEGKFSLVAYKQVLEANNHSPGSFERLVRDDVSVQRWDGYFRHRIRFSEDEIRKEFINSRDKRNIKYVLLTSEGAKKNISVSSAEIQKFSADSAKLNLAKLKYEEGKSGTYKGQSFDQAKDAIARSILAGEKLDEIQKINQKLADQILPLLTAGKANDAKMNALLKAYDVQVKSTGFITREQTYVPGIGEAKELTQDAFATKPVIDLTSGGKAKKYQLADRILIAAVSETQKPDLSQLAEQRDTLIRQVVGKKMKDQYQEWMKKLSAKAKIDKNPSVIGAAVVE
jgi:parvulin-like peptidyl-prolyl isomerase